MHMPFCLSKTPFARVAPAAAAVYVCATLTLAAAPDAAAAPTETPLYSFAPPAK
jgi:hypothetical protein